MRKTGKVIVALSGGVDSAVAALLLRRQGYEVEGLFMNNWEEDDSAYCTSAQDYQDARAVAAELGIPLHRVDLSEAYRQRVFRHFLDEYAAGRTPNPDILCNREIKFGDCLAHARRLGMQYLATGHYARIEQWPEGPVLLKGVDSGKDQSYFLHAVRRPDFAQVLMPLGGFHKSEVRDLARSAGLPVHAKRDSTGICFIGERPFRQFLEGYLSTSAGPIQTLDGERLGEHQGLSFYTLGQRSGLALGGRKGHAEAPWYVVAKDRARNVLVVAQGENHPALFSRRARVAQANWLCPVAAQGFPAGVRYRYRQPDQRAWVEVLEGGEVMVTAEEPQRAVTPGQSAVFYAGERCLGGGVIVETDV
ncbi:MAG: hypothetical protein RL026_1112 [Pseudomonadota bacterium]|jgi:tRNA-specific 2-thiouridylase